MDQSASPDVVVQDDPDTAISAILDRARVMTGDDLVALARRYAEACDPSTTPDGIDRRRVLALARARAADGAPDRADALRALDARVADALRDVGAAEARRSLRRLGILEHAERAVADAVFAVALRDRLGRAVAVELARPFEAVR